VRRYSDADPNAHTDSNAYTYSDTDSDRNSDSYSSRGGTGHSAKTQTCTTILAYEKVISDRYSLPLNGANTYANPDTDDLDKPFAGGDGRA
jgi:hypothetical protein